MSENNPTPRATSKNTTDLEKQASTFGYPLPDRNTAATDSIDEVVEGMFEQLEEDLIGTPNRQEQVQADNNEST